ncbi:MAG: ABC transporter permease [Chloroflexi bacterium]|nr:MAG: ABC transporter permease [Chloroflexota bacterium]
MNWRIVAAIARKDIVDAVKNLYVLFSLVLPVGVFLLFGLMFPDADEIGTMTVAVYDQGDSRLVSGLRAVPGVLVLEVDSEEELLAKTQKTVVAGLVLPAGLDAAVQAGQQPEVAAYLNMKRGGGQRAALQRLVEQQIWGLVGRAEPARITWHAAGQPAAGQAAPEFQIDRYLLIMIVVMGLAMTGAFVVPTLLVEEKEKHTLAALLLSPARPVEVVMGKALTGLFYSLLLAGLLLVLDRGWMGNWPVTLVAVVLGSFFAVTVGLLMGGLFRTTNQVNTWSTVAVLAIMAPSWTTMIDSPPAMDVALRLIPTYYLGHALQLSLAGEATLAGVWLDFAGLAGGTALLLAAVVWTWRREGR